MTRMTKNELNNWVESNSTTKEISEGTPKEALMAGWVNAMDMQDANPDMTEAEFIEAAYSEFNNMGYSDEDLNISRG